MRILRVDAAAPAVRDLERAVDWLRADRILAMPTETFYGLAVDPRSAAAVAALIDLKRRPGRLALPLAASSMAQVEAICRVSPLARRLAARFWPGPLSLVLDARADVAPGVAAADGSVAIRVSSHPVVASLAGACGHPLTATSANRSGQPPARGVRDLGDILQDARVLAVDAGETPGGDPSTIVDARGSRPALIREGAVPWSHVLESNDR